MKVMNDKRLHAAKSHLKDVPTNPTFECYRSTPLLVTPCELLMLSGLQCQFFFFFNKI